MHILYRRYTRTSAVSTWFVGGAALAFALLAVAAVVASNWLVFALAVFMLLVALAAVPVSRRLAEALRASSAAVDDERTLRDG
jgi:hypothetical protein